MVPYIVLPTLHCILIFLLQTSNGRSKRETPLPRSREQKMGRRFDPTPGLGSWPIPDTTRHWVPHSTVYHNHGEREEYGTQGETEAQRGVAPRPRPRSQRGASPAAVGDPETDQQGPGRERVTLWLRRTSRRGRETGRAQARKVTTEPRASGPPARGARIP